MRLLGNLYIKKAYLDTWNKKVEGWLDEYSRIVFNGDVRKNRLYSAVIELEEGFEMGPLFHELEHYYILKALLSTGLRLNNYFKAKLDLRHAMMSDYKG